MKPPASECCAPEVSPCCHAKSGGTHMWGKLMQAAAQVPRNEEHVSLWQSSEIWVQLVPPCFACFSFPMCCRVDILISSEHIKISARESELKVEQSTWNNHSTSGLLALQCYVTQDTGAQLLFAAGLRYGDHHSTHLSIASASLGEELGLCSGFWASTWSHPAGRWWDQSSSSLGNANNDDSGVSDCRPVESEHWTWVSWTYHAVAAVRHNPHPYHWQRSCCIVIGKAIAVLCKCKICKASHVRTGDRTCALDAHAFVPGAKLYPWLY